MLNLPLTRSSAINASILLITWCDITGVEQQMISNMADGSSSSYNTTNYTTSIFVQLFGCRRTFRMQSTRKYRAALHRNSTPAFWAAWKVIRSWRSLWVARKHWACLLPAVISIAKNGECLDVIEQLLCTMRSTHHLISSMLWMLRIVYRPEYPKI